MSDIHNHEVPSRHDAQPDKDHPVEGVSFPDIMSNETPKQRSHDSRETGLSKLNNLFESGNMGRQDRGETNALKSSVQKDRGDGQQLLAMFQANDYKQVQPGKPTGHKPAEDPWHRQASNLSQKEIEAIRRISDPPSPNSLFASSALLRLLNSSEPSEKKDGQLLISMLTSQDPELRFTARRLLELFCHDEPILHQTLKVLHDPKQKEMAQNVRELLLSDDRTKAKAGANLCGMLFGTDEMAKTNAQKLLSTIRTGNNQDKSDAYTLLTTLSDNYQIRQMLQVRNTPKLERASQRLLTMLGDEETRDTAAYFLDFSHHPLITDEIDVKLLLQMLNSRDAEEYKDATRVLRLMPGMSGGERRYLLYALNKNDTKPEARKTLTLLEGPNREERKLGEQLLELLGSGLDMEQQIYSKLSRRLSGDGGQQEAARTILARLEDNSSRGYMLDLLESPKHKKAAEQLLKDLNGSPSERKAARTMLAVRSNFDGGIDVSDRLIQMNADPQQRGKVQFILSELDEPSQIRTLLDLVNKPDHKAAADALLRMHNSVDEIDQAAASELLKMVADGGLTFAGDILLKMISKSDQKDAARQILTQLHTRLARVILLAMMDGSEAAEKTARELLRNLMSNDREERRNARLVLNNLDTPEQVTEMWKIMKSPGNQFAATALRRMLEPQGGSPRFARMMTHEDITIQNVGEDLLKMLNDPKQEHIASGLLRSKLSDLQIQALLGLRTHEDFHVAGHKLSNLFLSDNREEAKGTGYLLTRFLSDDKQTRDDAVRIIGMLSNTKQQADALVEIRQLGR